MSFIEYYRRAQSLPSYTENKEFFQKLAAIFKEFRRSANPQREQNAINELKGKLLEIKNTLDQKQDAEELSEISKVLEETESLPSPVLPVPSSLTAATISEHDLDQLWHHHVNPSELKSNGLLYTNEEINQFKEDLKEDSFLNSDQQHHIGSSNSITSPKILRINGALYGVHRVLGKGGEGVVYLMQNLEDGSWCAGKQRIRTSATINYYITREIENLDAFKKFKGELTYYDSEKRQCYTFIAMSLEQGVPFLSETTGSVLTSYNVQHLQYLTAGRDILKAAKVFWDNDYINRDYKTENILFYRKGSSLIDFSFATKRNNLDTVTDSSYLGTEVFIAPELYEEWYSNKKEKSYKYNEKTEVYTLGMLVAESFDLVDSSRNRATLKEPTELFKLEPIFRDAYEYLQKMTAEKPDERPTIQEALEKFEILQSRYLWYNARLKKVAMVDIAELINATTGILNQDNVKKLLPALREADAVWLIDQNNVFADSKFVNVNALAHGLEKSQVAVAGVLNVANKDTEFDINNHMEALVDHCEVQNADAFINTYYLATTKQPEKTAVKEPREPKKYTKIVCNSNRSTHQQFAQAQKNNRVFEYHYEWVIKNLFIKIEALEKNHILLQEKTTLNTFEQHEKTILNDRIAAIKATRKDLREAYANKTLNYAVLQEKLTMLESKMVHRNLVKHKFCIWFGQQQMTAGRRYVKALREDIQPKPTRGPANAA